MALFTIHAKIVSVQRGADVDTFTLEMLDVGGQSFGVTTLAVPWTVGRDLGVGAILSIALSDVAGVVLDQTVSITDAMTFDPTPITVGKCSKITWTNNDDVGHTVTADAHDLFDSGPLAPLGVGTFSRHFDDDLGTYAYHCSIHTTMHGSVIVSETPIYAPVDAHTYDGHITGCLAEQYKGYNVTNLVVKSYSRTDAPEIGQVDTHIADGDSPVAADGTWDCNEASNPKAVASQFVFKVFDGDTQVGVDLALASS